MVGKDLDGVVPLLAMSGISKAFKGVHVLEDVGFTLAPGEVHALLGANGAGKSTLIKILAGLYPDYDGDIQVAGSTVRMQSPRTAIDTGIAVIYQEFALAPDLTVAENIALGREPAVGPIGGYSRSAVLERSKRECEAIGIDLPLNRQVGELGVAEQQMTEIVKAVARDARVLVMDEPTARLSGKERSRLFQLIRDLSSRGVGIIYVSHFLEEIFEVATRATVLRNGRLVTTTAVADESVSSLARLMVGDKLDALTHQRRVRPPTDASLPPALSVRGLTVEGHVEDASFDILQGEVLGFAGLEGSGRTHLARALVGAERVSVGEISAHGEKAKISNPTAGSDRGVVMLPADRKAQGMLMVRPVSENIEITALRRRLTRLGMYLRRSSREVVRELIDSLGLKPKEPAMIVSGLSGGNQQKVAIARALAAEASIILFDQPTAGVDVGAKADIYGQIDAFTARGGSALIISDDLDELLRLSDRVILMDHGVLSEPRDASDFDRVSLLAAINNGRLASMND